MAENVAAHPFAQGGFGVDSGVGGGIAQGEGEFVAPGHEPGLDEQTLHREVGDEVPLSSVLLVLGDSCHQRGEAGDEVLPAERAAVGDGRFDEGGGGLEQRFVDAEVGPTGGFGLPPPRRGEAEDPPDVLGSREVDRAALGPRAHDRSGLDLRANLGEVPGLRAQRHGDERPAERLGLHAREPTDRLGGGGGIGPDET
ncbi:Uncharacterised protein [Mycobacteroides abscessus subsp. abscessus]|nr:Uncharacterised protein [Mycobacteroides abscessus subsp. abscessus]